MHPASLLACVSLVTPSLALEMLRAAGFSCHVSRLKCGPLECTAVLFVASDPPWQSISECVLFVKVKFGRSSRRFEKSVSQMIFLVDFFKQTNKQKRLFSLFLLEMSLKCM